MPTIALQMGVRRLRTRNDVPANYSLMSGRDCHKLASENEIKHAKKKVIMMYIVVASLNQIKLVKVLISGSKHKSQPNKSILHLQSTNVYATLDFLETSFIQLVH